MTLLPPWLPPSAATDIGLLVDGLKPAVRIHVGDNRIEMRRWARRLGLFTSTDRDGYAVLSRSGAASRRALDIDRRPGRHTIALGRMLGYPECCNRAAARVGDEGIDALCDDIAARRFRGRFRAIDPGAYAAGRAAISHVPCSHTCNASAIMAERRVGC